MLNNFLKYLGFHNVNSKNMNHEPCEKFMFKFEDEVINQHWKYFYAIYRSGYTDACNKIGVLAIKGVNDEL